MEIIPLEDYVIIKRLEENSVTESGIILPEMVDKEAVNIGFVTAIGNKLDVAFKDKKVLFKPYGFDEIVFNKQTLLVGKAENIMGVIKDD